MVDPKVPETEDSAEKAYAAASEGVSAKPVPPVAETDEALLGEESQEAAPEATVAEEVPAPEAVATPPAPVAFPAKAKRVNKPRAVAAPAVTEPAPAKPVTAKTKPAPKAKLAPKAKPAPAVKAAPTAKVVKKAPAKPVKPIVTKTDQKTTISQLKDKIMATTTKTPDFTKGIQEAIADIQEKTKAAFEKSTVSFGEVSEFAKGNVEALVESGKIFAAGVQELGTAYVSESRSAFEALTTDVKELASSKTPADFLKLQSDLLRRNFDAAVAASSKNSEAFFKLTNEAFAPISGRFSLAVEKIKKAA